MEDPLHRWDGHESHMENVSGVGLVGDDLVWDLRMSRRESTSDLQALQIDLILDHLSAVLGHLQEVRNMDRVRASLLGHGPQESDLVKPVEDRSVGRVDHIYPPHGSDIVHCCDHLEVSVEAYSVVENQGELEVRAVRAKIEAAG